MLHHFVCSAILSISPRDISLLLFLPSLLIINSNRKWIEEHFRDHMELNMTTTMGYEELFQKRCNEYYSAGLQCGFLVGLLTAL